MHADHPLRWPTFARRSTIETCRTSALGGHVERCEDCAHTRVAYNSCRNRHCLKCQGAAARQWLAEREAELLPVPYYHVQNKAIVYDLLVQDRRRHADHHRRDNLANLRRA